MARLGNLICITLDTFTIKRTCPFVSVKHKLGCYLNLCLLGCNSFCLNKCLLILYHSLKLILVPRVLEETWLLFVFIFLTQSALKSALSISNMLFIKVIIQNQENQALKFFSWLLIYYTFPYQGIDMNKCLLLYNCDCICKNLWENSWLSYPRDKNSWWKELKSKNQKGPLFRHWGLC